MYSNSALARPLVALITLGFVVVALGAPATAGAESRVSAGRQAMTVRLVGSGTPESCTSAKVVKAIAAGGKVRFNCGPDPVTIRMLETAKVVNTNRKTVINGKGINGGGMVTLSGAGKRRILYQNTCDAAQTWTTNHCDNQRFPTLVVKNLKLREGNSTGELTEGGGGGAMLVRGGQLRVINSIFVKNRCDRTGPDLGGAAIRVLSHWTKKRVLIDGSKFRKGRCSNGAALSSIGVSWRILDSVFKRNKAIGHGANPAEAGTPGGGSGGAIYMDGDRIRLMVRRTTMSDNSAREGGGAIFFVSNNRTGTATFANSTLIHNVSESFETDGFPGIYFLGKRPPRLTHGTTIS